MDKENIACQLLQMMLKVALLEEPYPGQNSGSTYFPDIERVQDLEEIVVSDRNLGSACKIIVPGYRIQILSDEEIVSRGADEGALPYFQLTELDIRAGEATLSMQLAWSGKGTDTQTGVIHLGGGGVRVHFVLVAGEWQAPSGPSATWIS